MTPKDIARLDRFTKERMARVMVIDQGIKAINKAVPVLEANSEGMGWHGMLGDNPIKILTDRRFSMAQERRRLMAELGAQGWKMTHNEGDGTTGWSYTAKVAK